MLRWSGNVGFEDKENAYIARCFFKAATKQSNDCEDILPQECGEDVDHSVFYVFARVFPEIVGEDGAGGKLWMHWISSDFLVLTAKNKRMRLHFNKIGYQIYGKEQSRRVPSLRAKPGNPGYGFKRARWRDTLHDEEDKVHCDKIMRKLGCDEERILKAQILVQEIRYSWERARRPSRPAGPGRPRRQDSGQQGEEDQQERGCHVAGPIYLPSCTEHVLALPTVSTLLPAGIKRPCPVHAEGLENQEASKRRTSLYRHGSEEAILQLPGLRPESLSHFSGPLIDLQSNVKPLNPDPSLHASQPKAWSTDLCSSVWQTFQSQSQSLIQPSLSTMSAQGKPQAGLQLVLPPLRLPTLSPVE
eukprot:673506-Hanusia_phi.AAC.1